MASLITLGLAQIMVGAAASNGTMPGSLAKIGKTYRDTCKVNQAVADVTEHFEEGKAAPEYRKKTKKVPVVTFSMMDPDPDALAAYIGGTVTNGKWGFDGSEIVTNKAIQVQTEQGLWIDIPNADIEANINSDLSAKGIFLVEFTVTPMSVSSGKAIYMYNGSNTLTVDPTSLSFTSAADSTGKTITATSTGNVTYAAAEVGADWLTVTRALKVVTVKVLANANSEARTANVTIVADGITAVVPVTQAGA